MLTFSQTTGYAVLALACIGSWKGQRVRSGQIHKCTGIPKPYLEKILFGLARCGFINSKRGYRGGFVLARPAEEITLLEVAECVEHHTPGPDCVLRLPGCSEATPCPLRNVWPKIRAVIEAELRGITIAQAAESVVAARWGRLTKKCCAPDGKVPRRTPAKKKTPGRKKAPRSRRS
jgi:Rrf2 family protein